MRSENEIEDVIASANEAIQQGSKFPGMSYEEGVQQALMWVIGQGENPLED